MSKLRWQRINNHEAICENGWIAIAYNDAAIFYQDACEAPTLKYSHEAVADLDRITGTTWPPEHDAKPANIPDGWTVERIIDALEKAHMGGQLDCGCGSPGYSNARAWVLEYYPELRCPATGKGGMMGHRIIQRIYTCDKCGIIPEDGERMWWMGNKIWCEKCCDDNDNDKKDDGE